MKLITPSFILFYLCTFLYLLKQKGSKSLIVIHLELILLYTIQHLKFLIY